MSRSWPTQIWDPRNPNADDAGMAPYTPPADPGWLVGKDKGLPDDWQDYDIKTNVWDALENPLYKVAAAAKGIDFEDFKSRVGTQLGTEDEYEFTPAEMVTYGQQARRKKEGGWTEDTRVSYNKTAYEEALQEWKDDEDRDPSKPPQLTEFTDSGPQINEYGFSGKTGTIYGDMQKMNKWLSNIDEKSEKKGSYKVISEGPQGSDYGIVGDIWEHYGLDKAPEAPKELDDSYFSYQENFDQAISYGAKDEWINAALDLASNPDAELEVTTNQGGDKAT